MEFHDLMSTKEHNKSLFCVHPKIPCQIQFDDDHDRLRCVTVLFAHKWCNKSTIEEEEEEKKTFKKKNPRESVEQVQQSRKIFPLVS